MTSYGKLYRNANNEIMNTGLNKQQREDIKKTNRYKACLSKIGYDTEFEAQIKAAKLNKFEYKCQYCPHYHLTSKEIK